MIKRPERYYSETEKRLNSALERLGIDQEFYEAMSTYDFKWMVEQTLLVLCEQEVDRRDREP